MFKNAISRGPVSELMSPVVVRYMDGSRLTSIIRRGCPFVFCLPLHLSAANHKAEHSDHCPLVSLNFAILLKYQRLGTFQDGCAIEGWMFG